MENVGNSGVVNKKPWIIGFSVVGVVIVGLVIAIVVVSVVRNTNSREASEDVLEANDAISVYFDDNGEIAKTIVDEKLDGDAILKLIKEKIDTAEDETVKAMLEEDYYTTMFSVYGADATKKDEILNGLIRVDELLHTFDSAEAVATMALAYSDFDLYQKYVTILKELDPNYQSAYEAVEGLSR